MWRTFLAVVVLVSSALGDAALANGARLFSPLTAPLSEAEASWLGEVRQRSDVISALPVRLNRRVLGWTVVRVSIDGKDCLFVGEQRETRDGVARWWSTPGPANDGAFLAMSHKTEDGTGSGSISVGNRSYDIRYRGDLALLITEVARVTTTVNADTSALGTMDTPLPNRPACS